MSSESHHSEIADLPGALSREELRGLVARGEIDTILTVMPDTQGRIVGKRVTGRFFVDEVMDHGVHACAYLLTVDMEMEPLPGFDLSSWESGYQDFRLVPDLGTLRRAAWLEATAIVMCDVVDDQDRSITVAPREILKKQVERAHALGFEPQIGSELELYIFNGSYEAAAAKHWQDLETFGTYIEDYHILQTTKEEPLVREIRNALDASAIPVEFSKGEWGPGQEEINLRYAPAIEMADRHAIYKNAAKEIAHRRGMMVTYMAKWNSKLAGNSCHIHSSLTHREGGKSAFVDDAGKPTAAFRGWLGGQLAHTRELALLYAPTVNSYKRYQAASFAPTRIAWGTDNRTCGLRVVGAGPGLRVENRVPGADCNPYLAFAAAIAAGLDGIENELDPGEETKGDAYVIHGLPEVPKTLAEATDRFAASKLARAAFGDLVVDHYALMARHETAFFDRTVSALERARYFERI